MNALSPSSVLALVAASFLLSLAPPADPAPAAGPAALTADGEVPALAWSDYDGDGLLDLLVHHAEGPLLLLRNTGRELVDVTEQVGLDALTHVRCTVWVDLDRDGWSDLLAVLADGSVRALRNDAGIRLLVRGTS